MKVKLALVAENTEEFINQVKLCIYSLRKNGGKLKDIPITLITNNKSLDIKDENFLKKHFSPIEFKVMPRLGAIPHTSKLNSFYAINPSSYDVLMFMDCDTVVVKPLDDILHLIKKHNAQFVCRRGGGSDRNNFTDFDSLVKEFCGKNTKNKIFFKGKQEWPMFNTGVFLATSDTVKKIRHDSIDFTYTIYNRWINSGTIERLPLFKYLYKFKILQSKRNPIHSWSIEQGAVALSCIKAGVRVKYLDEKYNSWGNFKNLKILHCFKSAYKFDREKMFTKDSDAWIKEYQESDLHGMTFLANIMKEYKNKYFER